MAALRNDAPHITCGVSRDLPLRQTASCNRKDTKIPRKPCRHIVGRRNLIELQTIWYWEPFENDLIKKLNAKRFLKTQHGNNRTKTDHLFKVLRKCNSKFDCLVYEMLYIKDIKPSLNTQADSIRAKLFTWHFRTFFSLIVFLTLGIIPIGPANILCIVSNFIYSFYTLYFFTFQLDNGVT